MKKEFLNGNEVTEIDALRFLLFCPSQNFI